jgi:hypothetical protein
MQIPKDDTNPDIEEDLAALAGLPIAQLREQWRATFRKESPQAFGPDLLRRRIAYRIQERAYGGLSPSTQRELDRLVRGISKNPHGRIALPRRMKTGAVLIREWKGKTHRVTVADDGFTYDTKNYSNLSEIARKITGARWNGPRFFGLRKSTLNDTPAEERMGAQ